MPPPSPHQFGSERGIAHGNCSQESTRRESGRCPDRSARTRAGLRLSELGDRQHQVHLPGEGLFPVDPHQAPKDGACCMPCGFGHLAHALAFRQPDRHPTFCRRQSQGRGHQAGIDTMRESWLLQSAENRQLQVVVLADRIAGVSGQQVIDVVLECGLCAYDCRVRRARPGPGVPLATPDNAVLRGAADLAVPLRTLASQPA